MGPKNAQGGSPQQGRFDETIYTNSSVLYRLGLKCWLPSTLGVSGTAKSDKSVMMNATSTQSPRGIFQDRNCDQYSPRVVYISKYWLPPSLHLLVLSYSVKNIILDLLESGFNKCLPYITQGNFENVLLLLVIVIYN